MWDHCCVLLLTTWMLDTAKASAASDFPSGDQRGENSPTAPGRAVTCPLATSRMRIVLFRSLPTSLLLENAISRPSGDQFASVSGPASSGRSRRGVLP